MKKQSIYHLSKLLIMLLSTFLITVSCSKEESNTAKTDECAPDLEARAKMKKQIITNDNVFAYYKNYTENRTNLLNELLKEKYGNDFNDTRTILFDFKVLKEYIKYVEEVSKKYGTTPGGIKVAFGAYPNEGDYKNQANVFFTPTTSDDGVQSAYTISNDKVVFFRDLKQLPKIQKGSFMMLAQQGNEGLGLNGGQMSPPPPNGDPDFQ